MQREVFVIRISRLSCVLLALLTAIAVSGCNSPAEDNAATAASDVSSPAGDDANGDDAQGGDANEQAGSGTGSDAPDAMDEITLRAVGREEYDQVIASHKGKVVLVDFWASWCEPCKQQFPHTVELADKYAKAGLAVVSVSVDEADQQEDALAFLKEKHATFDNLISKYGFGDDHAVKVFETGGQVPHYKLYDRTGKLRYLFTENNEEGVSEKPDRIEIRVKELLAEKAKEAPAESE